MALHWSVKIRIFSHFQDVFALTASKGVEEPLSQNPRLCWDAEAELQKPPGAQGWLIHEAGRAGIRDNPGPGGLQVCAVTFLGLIPCSYFLLSMGKQITAFNPIFQLSFPPQVRIPWLQGCPPEAVGGIWGLPR